MNHARWKRASERQASLGYTEPPGVVAEREQIRLALHLGQLVYERRVALGLSQAGLGERLAMTAEEVEAVELGGMLPVTTDLLVRLAAALRVAVDLHVMADGSNTVAFGEDAA